MRRTFRVLIGFVFVASLAAAATGAYAATATRTGSGGGAEKYLEKLACSEGSPLCAEANDSLGYKGEYTGHDEPSALFYSNTPGSGSESNYRVVIPTDPPILPKQDGSGGTFNFQDRIAFWFGMDLCDNQSAPEYTHDPCTPASDSNIFDGASTKSRLTLVPACGR